MASNGNVWSTYAPPGASAPARTTTTYHPGVRPGQPPSLPAPDKFVPSTYHYEINGPHLKITSTFKVPGRHELTTQSQSGGQQPIMVPRSDLRELARGIQRAQDVMASTPVVLPQEVPVVLPQQAPAGRSPMCPCEFMYTMSRQ